MSRDYKDAPSHRVRSRPHGDATPRRQAAQPATTPPWRWLAGGLGIGLAVAGFAYLILRPSEPRTPQYVQAEPPKAEAPAPTPEPVAPAPSAAAVVAAPATAVAQPPAAAPKPQPKAAAKSLEPPKPEGPHYDFYTLLPKLAVEIPDQEINRKGGASTSAAALSPDAAEQAPDKQPESYVLQAGSFRSSADAERLKAKLADLGLTAEVQSLAGTGNVTWYRVRLGPYPAAKEMEKVRKKLQDNKIEPLVTKVKQ